MQRVLFRGESTRRGVDGRAQGVFAGLSGQAVASARICSEVILIVSRSAINFLIDFYALRPLSHPLLLSSSN